MKQQFNLTPHARPIPAITVWVLGILLPTACVIWFMTEAMNNERLAVRQKLIDAYRTQLISVQQQLEDHWQSEFDELNDEQVQYPTQIFARLVNTEKVSSLAVYGEDGAALYPSQPRSIALNFPERWNKAQQQEFQKSNPAASAVIYAEIAAKSDDINIEAMALQAQARSLAKAGNQNQAIHILSERLAEKRFAPAINPQGRLIQPDALLRALQLGSLDDLDQTEHQLEELINHYESAQMSSNQRRFLAEQLRILNPESGPFPLHHAEVLAASYLASMQGGSDGGRAQRLQSTEDANLWLFISSNDYIHSLFTREFIDQQLNNLLDLNGFQPGLRVEMVPPNRLSSAHDAGEKAAFIDIPLGEALLGWRLALYLEDDNILSSAASEQVSAYLWTGMLIIAAIFILASVIAHYLAKQLRLNRAKNDLIATVSHELKTPLSSIRVLVDTLLDDANITDRNSQEYLELISSENARLSQLIDNFLTFSRMERNKQPYRFVPTAPETIVNEAISSKQALLEDKGFSLSIDIQNDLPLISADKQLLVTVLVNLLDNASKYSGDSKQISVRTYQDAEDICFAVRDSGIGMSPRHRKKIFERFYRMDQSLSQTAEGCGLGLSIVEFIVRAHQGDIEVESAPGKGSTFIVRLPVRLSTENKNSERDSRSAA